MSHDTLHTHLLEHFRSRASRSKKSELPMARAVGHALQLAPATEAAPASEVPGLERFRELAAMEDLSLAFAGDFGVHAALLDAPRRHVRVFWPSDAVASVIGEGHVDLPPRAAVFDADAGPATLLVHGPAGLYVLTIGRDGVEELEVPAPAPRTLAAMRQLPVPDWEAWREGTPDEMLMEELGVLESRADDLGAFMGAALLDNYHEGEGESAFVHVARLRAGLPVAGPMDSWLASLTPAQLQAVELDAMHAVLWLEEDLLEVIAERGGGVPDDLPHALREERDRLECVWRTIRDHGCGAMLRDRLLRLDRMVISQVALRTPEVPSVRLMLAATLEPDGWWTATGGVLEVFDEADRDPEDA